MSIEERVAKILTAHFWIEHRMECACGDNGGKRPWAAYSADHVAHVARVLTTKLGLTEERAIDKPGHRGISPQRRYVTPWETT